MAAIQAGTQSLTPNQQLIMKVEELRIGNSVLYGDTERKITAIVGEKIGVDGLITLLVNLKPISLSPEILERYGFKHGATGEGEDLVEFWDKYMREPEHGFGGYTFSVVRWNNGDFTFSHHHIRSKCQYLHQLQNLFYILTNTSLTQKG